MTRVTLCGTPHPSVRARDFEGYDHKTDSCTLVRNHDGDHRLGSSTWINHGDPEQQRHTRAHVVATAKWMARSAS